MLEMLEMLKKMLGNIRKYLKKKLERYTKRRLTMKIMYCLLVEFIDTEKMEKHINIKEN